MTGSTAVAAVPDSPPPSPSVDAGDPASAWSVVTHAAAGQRALAWLRKTRLASLTPVDGDGGWTAVIEPLPGHGDLAAFATPARLAPAAELASELLGGRVLITMRPRADEPSVAPDRPSQTVDDLPLVQRMKEVFADYDIRLIGQWASERPAPPGDASDPDEPPEERV
ncbi:MAG: hypothetical protein AAGI54_06550 [Planctomycetota bacterium]